VPFDASEFVSMIKGARFSLVPVRVLLLGIPAMSVAAPQPDHRSIGGRRDNLVRPYYGSRRMAA
jgi:hypothetical protein